MGLSERQERLLDAAQARFVHHGFHRITMQDSAKEAAMSPANIYRYLDSKEGVVLGWAKPQRKRATAIIARLEQDGDRYAALRGIIEHYHLGTTRETAILRVDLWPESARNPKIAGMWKTLKMKAANGL